ncbi:hypothetical protein WKS98_08435 [Lagierella sp. ICN-221743]
MTKNTDDKKAYIYESHLGGLYVSDKEIPDDDLYYETCGDYDKLIFTMEDIYALQRLLNYLFTGYYTLDCMFELIEDLKKYYDDEEYIELSKEIFLDKIIQYASELKYYDKTFKLDVTATFEDIKTKEITREVNKEIVIKALDVDLAMKEARTKIIIDNFDLNEYFMKIKYNNIEVLDE